MKIKRFFGNNGLGQILELREGFLRKIDDRVHTVLRQADQRTAILGAQEAASRADSLADHCQPSATARDEFTIRHMLMAGLHLGHSTSRWNPRMAPFIHGSRNGIHIVDLEKSLACLRQACQVLEELAFRDAMILFVGCSDKVRRLTYECAIDAGQFYVNDRWVGGTLTNAHNVLSTQSALYHSIGADPHGNTLRPHCLVLLEHADTVVAEADRCHVPTIALCDTDKDPTRVTYPIPGNDDGFAAVELVGRMLARAARQGRARRQRGVQEGDVVESALRFARQALNQHTPSLLA